MAQIMRPARPRNGLLATDGKPHPLQDTLLAVTLVLGVISSSPPASPVCTC